MYSHNVAQTIARTCTAARSAGKTKRNKGAFVLYCIFFSVFYCVAGGIDEKSLNSDICGICGFLLPNRP